jgi:hypothetical protein
MRAETQTWTEQPKPLHLKIETEVRQQHLQIAMGLLQQQKLDSQRKEEALQQLLETCQRNLEACQRRLEAPQRLTSALTSCLTVYDQTVTTRFKHLKAYDKMIIIQFRKMNAHLPSSQTLASLYT